jgi:hypothetical protein
MLVACRLADLSTQTRRGQKTPRIHDVSGLASGSALEREAAAGFVKHTGAMSHDKLDVLFHLRGLFYLSAARYATSGSALALVADSKLKVSTEPLSPRSSSLLKPPRNNGVTSMDKANCQRSFSEYSSLTDGIEVAKEQMQTAA